MSRTGGFHAGYKSKAEAQQIASRLRKQGYDVTIRYSKSFFSSGASGYVIYKYKKYK